MLDKDAEIVRLNKKIVELQGELDEWYRQAGEGNEERLARRLHALKTHFGLTPSQGGLLCVLLDYAPSVISKVRLLEYRPNRLADDVDLKIVDVFVSKLRGNLAARGWPDVITTAWGQGYFIKAETAEAFSAALADLAHA